MPSVVGTRRNLTDLFVRRGPEPKQPVALEPTGQLRAGQSRPAPDHHLFNSNEPGNFIARQPAMVERLLDETRRPGHGRRSSDLGGHFDKSRREWNDHRDSIAVPVWASDEVIAAVNLTWMHKVATVQQIVKSHLPEPTSAAREISMRLMAP